jgi:GTP-binding protein EngB required for normal cell division
MFPQQTSLLQALPVVNEVAQRYKSWVAPSTDWLDIAQKNASHFVVPVPLIGAFSAGKSSLINAVIGQPMLSTAIDPETALPAEVWHSDTESLVGCTPDGRRVPISAESLRANQLADQLGDGAWVEVATSIPAMRSMPHLKLVDMPGWDSGIKKHSQAIDGYAARSLAYGVVVSADEGDVRESIRAALLELAGKKMPIFVVITKIDKKPPEDHPALKAQIEQAVAKTLGFAPFKVCMVSARKKDHAEFLAALQNIESRSQVLFAENVAKPMAGSLSSLSAHLNTLLNSDDLTSEKIAVQCAQLNQDMQAFAGQLQKATAALDERVRPVLGRIRQRMEAKLLAQLESLASSALSGQDLSGAVGTTLRLAAEEGWREDFAPEVNEYLGRVADALPATFTAGEGVTFGLSSLSNSGTTSKGMGAAVLPAVLAPVLTLLTSPIGAAIGAAVMGLLTMFVSKRAKEDEERRRREQAIAEIRNNLIPHAMEKACEGLGAALHDSVAQAKAKIADSVEKQRASHDGALRELQAQLAQGQASFAQQCEQYRADKSTIDQLVAQLG